MTSVDIIVIDHANVILRAKGSELLILDSHARELRKLNDPKAFVNYFFEEALINRSARKLFESWLRRDPKLWQNLYQKIQDEVKPEEDSEGTEVEEPKVTKKASKAASGTDTVVSEPTVVAETKKKAKDKPREAKEKPVKKVAKTTKKDATEKKVTTKKTAKKTAEKKTTATKKTASKKVTKAAPTTKKTATKKVTKKVTKKK